MSMPSSSAAPAKGPGGSISFPDVMLDCISAWKQLIAALSTMAAILVSIGLERGDSMMWIVGTILLLLAVFLGGVRFMGRGTRAVHGEGHERRLRVP